LYKNRLHRAACEWLAAKNLLREAARHTFQTQDWEYAAAFVEQYSFSLIVHSEIATIYEWCLSFPEEVLQRRPMLCILQGLALAYGFQRQNRDRVKARLQLADRMIAKMEDRQLERVLIDLASVVRTFLAMAPDPAADPQELLTLGQGILDAYPEGDGSQFSGFLLKGYADLARQDAEAAGEAFGAARQIALRERLYFGIVESTFHLARLAHSQGRLHQAEDICLQAKADIETMLAHPEQELPALGCLDIAYGCLLMEQDHLDSAEHHLRHGLDLMGGEMNPYYLMTAYLALFRLFEIQNRSAEAIQCLDHLEAIWPDLAFCTGGLRVMHVLDTSQKDPGGLADIENWSHHFSSTVREATFFPGMGPLGAAEAYYLASTTWVRAQLTLGQPQAAYLTSSGSLIRQNPMD
jgi:LuxR family maltose regulon positive regulatory protein